MGSAPSTQHGSRRHVPRAPGACACLLPVLKGSPDTPSPLRSSTDSAGGPDTHPERGPRTAEPGAHRGRLDRASTDKAHGGVTGENIFEKYFIHNALRKHRTRPQFLPRVCWRPLSEGGRRWQEERKQDTDKAAPRPVRPTGAEGPEPVTHCRGHTRLRAWGAPKCAEHEVNPHATHAVPG